MAIQKKEFKGVWIPKEVYLNRDTCWTSKMIFIEINSYSSSNKSCFVSNDTLGKKLGISATQVSKHISKLITLGWIEQTGFDGRKRYLKTCLGYGFKKDLNKSLSHDEENGDFDEQEEESALNKTSSLPETGENESLEPDFNHTNTVTNSFTNQVEKEIIGQAPDLANEDLKAAKKKEERDNALEVLDYLNKICQKNFKPTKGNIEFITGRFKDGFTIDELKLVVDFKAKGWLSNLEYNQYLQPSTLFGLKKCDGYLQAAIQDQQRSGPQRIIVSNAVIQNQTREDFTKFSPTNLPDSWKNFANNFQIDSE